MQKATKTMVTLVLELDYCQDEDTIKFFVNDVFDKQLRADESVQIVEIQNLYEDIE